MSLGYYGSVTAITAELYSMVLVDIIEEHLEEVDFLWHYRNRALDDRLYTLDRLAELEERLFGHLEGLILGGKDAWSLLKPKLIEADRGDAFAAAFVALASEQSSYRDELFSALEKAKGYVLDGIRDAFQYSHSPEAERVARAQLTAANHSLSAFGLDVLSFRRASIDVKLLHTFLSSENSIVFAAAARAVGCLRVKPLLSRLEMLFESNDPVVRHEAVRAAFLIGSHKALAQCRTAVKQETEEAADALILLGLSGQQEDVRLLIEALNQPNWVRNAVDALGWCGYALSIDSLIPLLTDAKLSRVAGHSIARITGINLQREDLLAASSISAPQPVTSGQASEELDDDDFVEDPDEGLPIPDPAKLAAWWKTNASRFSKTTRYRNGQSYSRQVLIDMLQHANLADRHHAAFELVLLDPAAPFLETHAFVELQQRELVRLR